MTSPQNAIYSPGMRTIIRDEEWTITKVDTNTLDRPALYCVGTSPLVRNREAIFLPDLEEIEIVDPKAVRLVPDPSQRFRRSKLYIESLWRAQTPTGSKIYVGHKAAMDPLPYQLDPAAIALGRPRRRILIADAVGLGKTLEAGVLLSELIARGKGRRILVVTVKSMTAQFQKEMWNRFTIPLVRLDSKKFKEIRRALPTNYNPFTYYDKTIVSVDTLKRDLEYRAHLEKAYWDVIVIDEAQNVAERGDGRAQRARLAKLLAERSDSMIMLSATPHDGSARSFASLMNILDPTAIPDPNNYTKEDVGGLCVRRFKKDVKDQTAGAFLERRVELVRAKANELEERAFDALASLRLKMDEKRGGAAAGRGMLFKTTLAKALFSSPAACAETIRNRIKKLDALHGEGKFADVPALQDLLDAVLAIGTSGENFSRYQALLALLKDPAYGWTQASDDRIVIFTERRATKNFLVEALRRDLAGIFKNPKAAIDEVDGETSDVDLQKKVEDFGREEAAARILVASDVASEGLNLHYRCHRLIHFDVPWSLMVFQQRNGRVDRYGQAKTPDIRYMLVESENKEIRGDMRIFEILVKKETEAAKNIGDPALLMKKFVVSEEEFRVAEALETGESAEHFESELKDPEEESDFFADLFSDSKKPVSDVETENRETLFGDREYLKEAFEYLTSNGADDSGEKSEIKTDVVQEIPNFGLSILVTPGLRKRLDALLPDEAKPQGARVDLTDLPGEMMQAMKKSMLNNAEETAWPTASYLWPLHPVFSYVGEKCSSLFGRGEAPVLRLGSLASDEIVFIIAGSIPNQRSAPVVDDRFAFRYKSGAFQGEVELDDFFRQTKFRETTPNSWNPAFDDPEKEFAPAAALVSDAVDRAYERFKRIYDEYVERTTPLLEAEEAKLEKLRERRRAAQLELFKNVRFGGERKKEEALDSVDKLFGDFRRWVSETTTIQDKPYVRIVAVVIGTTASARALDPGSR